MSFADKAFKAILKQFKEEGHEFKLDPEKCNKGRYIELDKQFSQLNDNSVYWYENPLDKETVPEIISSLKKYYLATGDSLSGTILAAEPKTEYDTGVLRQPPLPDFGHIQMRYEPPSYTEKEKPIEKKDDLVIEALDVALIDYLKAPGKTVCDFIIKKQNELKLKASEVYNPVYMSKQTYSKVISNQSKHPSFDTCIQFAFALKLNIQETTELLRLAGNAFSDTKYHRIVKFFIEKKEYNMYELNKCLNLFGLDLIGNILR